MKTQLYTCIFNASGGAYALKAYDLPSCDEGEITEHLENEGWDVIEIYDIKKQ